MAARRCQRCGTESETTICVDGQPYSDWKDLLE
jgi:hypothetical protein